MLKSNKKNKKCPIMPQNFLVKNSKKLLWNKIVANKISLQSFKNGGQSVIKGYKNKPILIENHIDHNSDQLARIAEKGKKKHRQKF